MQNVATGAETPFPVTSLPHASALIAVLQADGCHDLRAVPPERLTRPKHQRTQRVVVNGQAELDPEAAALLRLHPSPRNCLDFESIQFAVPIWAGTRPYRQLVFQWSCHEEENPGLLRHAEFLDDSGNDPRRPFAESLIRAVGTEGPIFVYNRGFEGGCLCGLAVASPDLASHLRAIDARLVDLLPIARNHYYHPAMQGSWSIKAVLPAVAPDLSYDDLAVRHGGMAQEAYLQLIQFALPDDRRSSLLRNGLLDYCRRDTMARVRLPWHFEGRTRSAGARRTARGDGRAGSVDG